MHVPMESMKDVERVKQALAIEGTRSFLSIATSLHCYLFARSDYMIHVHGHLLVLQDLVEEEEKAIPCFHISISLYAHQKLRH